MEIWMIVLLMDRPISIWKAAAYGKEKLLELAVFLLREIPFGG